MSEVWRFTGPPENWITAISLTKWALNEHNSPLWKGDIRPGDVVLFHSPEQALGFPGPGSIADNPTFAQCRKSSTTGFEAKIESSVNIASIFGKKYLHVSRA
jgi:hypothetical protein